MNHHSFLRPVELIVGVVVLLSVASVPVPRKGNVTPLPPLTAGAADRVENLHRQAEEQARSVASLTEETRQLSELLRVQQQAEMAHPPRGTHRTAHHPGIVAPHDPTRSDPTPSVGVPRPASPSEGQGL